MKYSLMLISKECPVAICTMGVTPLTVADTVEDPGVRVQNYLISSSHCVKVAANDIKNLWMHH